jgi:hypothetical protein
MVVEELGADGLFLVFRVDSQDFEVPGKGGSSKIERRNAKDSPRWTALRNLVDLLLESLVQ